MKKTILLLIPLIVSAQVQYSSSISPTYLMRISDGSEISLPFRLADLQLSYSYGNFDLKSNTALEARWKGNEAELEIRELYLAWYPLFGEIKFGKMIHTWGAADGNNPTDNINPYDFYYMFLAGSDRKIGVLSGSIKVYWKNFNIEGIYVPEHTANRLPFGEEDFPIKFPFEPEEYIDIDNSYEFGMRLQGTFNWADASLSYFNGYDRAFSLMAFTPSADMMVPPIPNFGYSKTDMIGADVVTFIGDFTVRSEVGYFRTKDDYDNSQAIMEFDTEADYIQYVLQVEYSGFSDINLGAQLLGTNVLSVEGTTFNGQTPVSLTKDNFNTGMGTPFAMIAEKALIVNGSTNFFDDRIEIEAMSLINLEETGYMLGVNVGYSPIENWELKLGVSKFIGDANDPENSFTQMEDFSHLSLGLEFNY
jgi:hypothetical protein